MSRYKHMDLTPDEALWGEVENTIADFIATELQHMYNKLEEKFEENGPKPEWGQLGDGHDEERWRWYNFSGELGRDQLHFAQAFEKLHKLDIEIAQTRPIRERAEKHIELADELVAQSIAREDTNKRFQALMLRLQRIFNAGASLNNH